MACKALAPEEKKGKQQLDCPEATIWLAAKNKTMINLYQGKIKPSNNLYKQSSFI